jgi:hypothetical protein
MKFGAAMILWVVVLAGLACLDQRDDPNGGRAGAPAALVSGEPKAESATSVTPLTVDSVSVVWLQLEPPFRTQLNASFCRFPTSFTWGEELAKDGACRLIDWPGAPPSDTINLDTGEIVVQVLGVDIPLGPPDPAWPCHRVPVTRLPDLRPGDIVRIRSAGGADVPAFDLSLPVPAAPHLSTSGLPGELRVGEPWDFAWTIDPVAASILEVYGPAPGADSPVLVSCQGPDLVSAHLPPVLTSLWPESHSQATVRVASDAEATTLDDPPSKLRITVWESGAEGDHMRVLRAAP